MRRRRVYAVGEDPYWLRAVAGVAGETIDVQTARCPIQIQKVVRCLPEPDPEGLLLLDPAAPREALPVVEQLRQRGWRTIVVVAADPSWRDAYELLRGNNAYDYWTKSYNPDVIRQAVRRCLAEIDGKEPEEPRELDTESSRGEEQR